ncbi:cyclophilin-like fold protein [Anaerosporobacter sp.]|uniref:cyclophilin-like fold protein n=1 Tax=Anaerosporobacter sp. TaxID=1872529 RepID=UPI00286F1FD1|nr:cyclophilin-like fold protein [Anaerosporobacter sp.]
MSLEKFIEHVNQKNPIIGASEMHLYICGLAQEAMQITAELNNFCHEPCDIYLWSDSSLVLFYTSFSNSYNYVPIGYIVDVTELTDALGSGSVSIEFKAERADAK